MNKDLEMAAELLEKERLSIAAVNNGKIVFMGKGRGVLDLIKALQNYETLLKGSYVADKVVGSAAALLMRYGNIKGVFASVISSRAVEILKSGDVELYFNKQIEFIADRTGKDICPLEKKCISIKEPQQAFQLLSQYFTA